MGKKHHISLISCKMIELTLEHGLCTMTPFAFCMYGEILIYPVGDLIEGHRYGKIAILLSKRLQAKESASQLYFNVFTMVCSVPCISHVYYLFSQKKSCNTPIRIASSSSFLIYPLISRPFSSNSHDRSITGGSPYHEASILFSLVIALAWKVEISSTHFIQR